MDAQKTGFWRSLPGILTGLAAMITAVGGLYLALSDRSEDGPQVEPSPPIPQPPPPKPEWTVLADEAFVSLPNGWPAGRFAARLVPQMERNVLEGKYRWSLQFGDAFTGPTWAHLFNLPYGPKVEFYAAIDISIVEASGYVAVALVFGKSGESDYAFKISPPNLYTLYRYDGENSIVLVDWTPGDFDTSRPVRIAVESVGGRLSFFINSKKVGEQLWHQDFLGGGFALSVSSRKNQSVVVDFDNFVLKEPN